MKNILFGFALTLASIAPASAQTAADGTRSVTRITDGYLKLLGDWIRGDVRGTYGRAEHLTETL